MRRFANRLGHLNERLGTGQSQFEKSGSRQKFRAGPMRSAFLAHHSTRNVKLRPSLQIIIFPVEYSTTMNQTATLAREFERESFRIDQLIWDAMALRAGESALFCGLSNSAGWIKRAVAVGVDVSVIVDDPGALGDLSGVAIKLLRGSTSMLPARDASFDATVAFHYLHEVDPFFHASVVSELGRVGKRCVIVEPAPPSDALGLRIASLYSRAKRELGQFENYHHVDYWRKLVAIVKSDVSYQTFAFTRTPPREAIRETIALIIDTMAAEATPEPYLDELRALAAGPAGQLLPQARCVVVGTATGKPLNVTAGTEYRDWLPPAVQRRATPFPLEGKNRAAYSGETPAKPTARVYSSPDVQPEFPAVEPPAGPAAAAKPGHEPGTTASAVARNAFGLPQTDAPVPLRVPAVSGDDGGDTFGLPNSPADAAEEFGWEWETPGEPKPKNDG
jgi:hypothetical protein